MFMGNIQPGYGDFYTHPAFDDLLMEVIKRFYVKEKNIWKLKVYWWIKDKKLPSGKIRKGGVLAGGISKLELSMTKFKEFRKV